MKKTSLMFIVFTQLLLGTISLKAQETRNEKTLKTKIDNYLSENVANGLSGAVLVAKGGKIILNKGYGMANKEQNIPNTPTTVFDIGSVTKQFTGAAILKLVQFNKLKVTDPLDKFFDDLPNDKKDITVHQLLTHSAGLLDVIGEGDFDHIPRELFFKELFASKLLHKPGSKHEYSNSGYSILARIIELVSGQDYESFLNEHLFKPAGMDQTGYLKPQWDSNLIARGYMRNVMDMGSTVARYRNDGKVSWVLKGNGGINSTQEDMYKWYKALKANKVLSKSLTDKLTTPYILEQENGSSYYAYGWAIFNSSRNTKIVSHNGSNGVYFHDFIWLPEEDVVIIFSTNAYSRQVEIAWRLEKMIFDENYQADPIKKNVYLLVYDFTKHNDPKKSNELLSLIKKEYSSDFKNSNVLNRIGYIILNTKKNLGWAIELFKLNVELFENDGNLWDSLGDGYLANDQKEEAIKSFKKAVELGNEDSLKKLKELL